jgi:putative transposase
MYVGAHGIYGAPRIHTQLIEEGYIAGKSRVARLMRIAGVIGVTRRKKWRTTTREINLHERIEYARLISTTVY